MSLDLHPEDLLDKWSRGEIAADEQERLDAHLALCSVCLFETRARADFRSEGDVSAADLDAMVSRALGSLASEASEKDARAGKVAAAHGCLSGGRRVPKSAFLLVAAIALLSVEALAGKWNPFRLTSAVAPRTTLALDGSEDEVAPAKAPGHKSSAHPARSAASEDPTAVVSAGDVTDEGDGTSPSPAPEARGAYVNVASVTNEVTTTRGNAALSSSPPLETAAMVFARANRERTAGDHAKARAAYATLFRRFPLSPEGTLAHATLGRMLLDDGDAGGALVELDTYLAQGDPALRESVLAARASALGRQAASGSGRRGAEVEAWQRLLDEYPASLYAPRARARIEQAGRL